MNRWDYLKQFISLIDSLDYNRRNVIIKADAELAKLLDTKATAHTKQLFHEEEFTYSRCLSWQKEMQTS